MTLSPTDPLVLIGVGTKFKDELAPRRRILLPRSTGPATAEVLEVISDTEAKLKKEFGGESGKGTSRVREKIEEAIEKGKDGLTFKVLPYIDQQGMYGEVYQRLKEGGCIGIFPEGLSNHSIQL